VSFEVLFTNVKPSFRTTIDIVVPVFNTEKYVIRTLFSAQNNLMDRHLIVVDDCSQDKSCEKIMEFCRGNEKPITFVSHLNNKGLSASRNTGIALARSPYICFLDSDDLHAPGILGVALDQLKANPDADFVQMRGIHFNNQTYRAWKFGDASVFNSLADYEFSKDSKISHFYFAEPNAALKILKTSFVENENLRFPEGKKFEDYSFHVQAVRRAKQVLLFNAPILFQRMSRSGHQITSSRDSSRLDFLDVIRIAFDEIDRVDDTESKEEFLRLVIRSANWCASMLPQNLLPEFGKQYFNILKSRKSIITSLSCPDEKLSVFENLHLIALKTNSIKIWLALISKKPNFALLRSVTILVLNRQGIKFLRGKIHERSDSR
jgi:glycosyltransferase involved in cell wall biosynthesis